MAGEKDIIGFNLHTSSDSALDILIGAGIDCAAAEQILSLVPKHDNEPGHIEVNSGNKEASQAAFEQRMMRALARG